jgi:hypothetical protein
MTGKHGGTKSLHRRALRTRLFASWSIVLGAFAILVGACILDHDRCDANEVHATPDALDYCVCAAGAIPDPKGYGCLRCGAHEVVKGAKCVCKDGFDKESPTASCKAVVGQPIGAACSDASPCTDPYPYCASDGPDAYCTKRDCSTDDCPSGYSCESGGGAMFCAKLPTGIDAPCTSNDDCAAFEAAECNTFDKKCVLGSCAIGKTDCPNGWSCCDIGAFIPGISFCAAPGGIMCPGKIVTP